MNQNFLKKIPIIKNDINWVCDNSGMVILTKQNSGIANRFAQKILKKPKTSFIHLDEFGSFVWQALDGKRDIISVGKLVKEHFGNKSEPLYERLAYFIKTLEINRFITLN